MIINSGHRIFYSRTGDFKVDDIIFKIGGKNKNRKQIKDAGEKGYLVKDNILYGSMKELGYTCYQKTESFDRLDSEMGVFGNVDFMFVKTQAGKGLIRNSTSVNDAFFIYNDLRIKQANERRIILEMIDASCELAVSKGKHPLEKGCPCISCVNKRKRLLEPILNKSSKFHL